MKENRQSIVFLNAVITGFFGGMLIAILHVIFHYFNINRVSPVKIMNFFYIEGNWLYKWYGTIFFILFISMLSIVIGIIYYLLLKKVRGWFMGFIFGIVLWGIYGVCIPLIYSEITLKQLFLSNSSIATASLFIVYGLFIGYSISYDYETTFKTNHYE